MLPGMFSAAAESTLRIQVDVWAETNDEARALPDARHACRFFPRRGDQNSWLRHDNPSSSGNPRNNGYCLTKPIQSDRRWRFFIYGGCDVSTI